jgi:hypothetical protein
MKRGVMIQKLYPNDTETYVQGEDDLQEHDRMFCVEKGDWEKLRNDKEIQESEKQKKLGKIKAYFMKMAKYVIIYI